MASVTDTDALEAFVLERGPALQRFAFLLTAGRGPEAEDLVQTVLARMLQRDLGPVEDLTAYARRALVNEHTSAGRRESTRRRALPRLAAEDRGTDADPADRFAVLAALRTLGDRERAAVVLRYYADLPDEEIADELGCARATVRSLVHRALPRLREHLTDPATGDPS